MKKLGFAVSLFAVILAGSSLLPAQQSPNLDNGFKPYRSYQGGNLDSISLMDSTYHAGRLDMYMGAGESHPEATHPGIDLKASLNNEYTSDSGCS